MKFIPIVEAGIVRVGVDVGVGLLSMAGILAVWGGLWWG